VDSKVVSAEVETSLDQTTVSKALDDAEAIEASSSIEASQPTAEEAETKKVNDDDRPDQGEARGGTQ
jgi:hypothetical protein